MMLPISERLKWLLLIAAIAIVLWVKLLWVAAVLLVMLNPPLVANALAYEDRQQRHANIVALLAIYALWLLLIWARSDWAWF